MATFYVLPPRGVLADRWSQFWQSLLPGLPLSPELPDELIRRIESAVGDLPDVFVLYRDDLPEELAVGSALCDAYGAEAGDQVVEVRWAGTYRPAPVRVHSFRVDPCSEPTLLCYNGELA